MNSAEQIEFRDGTMAYITQSQNSLGTLAQSPKTLWETFIARLSAYNTYRKTLNELRGLSTRELNDLGLNRSMLKRVAMEATYDS